MADKPRRNFAAFLTGQVEEEIPEAAKPPPEPPRATDAPLIPTEPPRRPATRVMRSAQAAPPTSPPMAPTPEGGETPIVALPDYAAPPGVVVSAGTDANGVEYVFEDDPGATPLVDPRYDADDRNWVRYRTSWGGFLRIIGIVILLIVVIVTARNRVYGWIDDQVAAGGDHGDPVPFTIQSGAAVNDVATSLADAGIINNATVFRYWLRCDVPNGGEITITGFLSCDTEKQFQAGDYELLENMTYQEVVDELDKGPIVEEIFQVCIPEGLRISQFIERILDENDLYDEEQLREALSDQAFTSDYLREANSLLAPYEGLLFPACYDVPEGSLTNEASIVARMSDEMDRRIERASDAAGGLPPEAVELGLDEYDVVVIASLIEEEAFLDEDRAKISRVIWNRVRENWLLGIDASACFAPDIPCSELTQEILDDPNPWNTRAVAGLPPTPISAPGQASLDAAFAPEAGEWFYYVLTNENDVEGAHTFAVTDDEFRAAKDICEAKGLGCG
ncbi:MAG: endolytic transglycosylase MltG [Actinomycetota bacterium]